MYCVMFPQEENECKDRYPDSSVNYESNHSQHSYLVLILFSSYSHLAM